MTSPADARYAIHRLPSTGTWKATFYPPDAAPYQPRLPMWLPSHQPEIYDDISSLMYLAQMMIADAQGRVGVTVGPLCAEDGVVQLLCHALVDQQLLTVCPGQQRMFTDAEVRDWVATY